MKIPADIALTKNGFVSIDAITHLSAFAAGYYNDFGRSYSGRSICDGILIDHINNSIEFIESTSPARPSNMSQETYRKDFIKKIKGTRFVLKYFSYKKCGEKYHGNNIKIFFTIVFSKLPAALSPGQSALSLLDKLTLLAIDPIPGISFKTPYAC
jgi:hypothetical protein